MVNKLFSGTTGLVLAASLTLVMPAQRANADLHGVIGAIVGVCVLNPSACQGQKKTTRSGGGGGISQAQRQQNRDVQNALNGFGWNVGTADGVLGRNSRNGISQYQAYMGWNADGTLDDFERNTLVDNWRKLQAGGGNAYPNMMSREGGRGLLKTALNPNYPAQFGDNVGGVGNNNQLAFGQTGQQQQTNQGGQVLNNGGTQQAGVLTPLPPLGGAASMASRCEIVTLKAQAGLGTSATDPDQALSEKFCDARSYSITKANGRIQAAGIGEPQLEQSCEQIKTNVQPAFATVGASPMEATFGQMQNINTKLGLANPVNAAAYGEICVGLGYRKDDAEMALAGALVLVGAGQMPYGELVGHHVREGFGLQSAPQAAQPWYNGSMDALENGAQPAFEPSSTKERIVVIRSAIQSGGLQAGVLAPLNGAVPASAPLVPLAPLED